MEWWGETLLMQAAAKMAEASQPLAVVVGKAHVLEEEQMLTEIDVAVEPEARVEASQKIHLEVELLSVRAFYGGWQDPQCYLVQVPEKVHRQTEDA